MDIRLSHIENKVVVYRKEVDATVGCGICLCCLVYHVLFVLLVGEFGKSPVAVALSTTSILCTYPVLRQLYICESEERKYPNKNLYFLQSDIVFFNCSLKNKSFWEHKAFFNHLYLTGA